MIEGGPVSMGACGVVESSLGATDLVASFETIVCGAAVGLEVAAGLEVASGASATA